MCLRLILVLLLFIAPVGRAFPADNDSITSMFMNLVAHAQAFGERVPREKVAVHLDNTGYYKGDKIWFQCYVVDGVNNAPTRLSHTLYVELLNPRGKVLARRILKIDNGRCHGSFSLTHLPFYSGFYEIRAYTKYMLNFGDVAVFSRVIPVFDQPKTAGDYTGRKMMRNIAKYPGTRPPVKSGPKVSVRFFPEGGNLIAGVPSRVAFEITGRGGVPLEGSGVVISEVGADTVARFMSVHEGRGFFEFTPELNEKYKAVVTCGNPGGEQSFSLPNVRPNGISLNVDNLSLPDSILVTIHPKKDAETIPFAGVAVTTRGTLWSYTFVNLNRERTLRLSSKDMPSGVAVITLFGHDGRTLAERMIFVNNGGWGSVKADFDKAKYEPLGRVVMDLAASDTAGKPAAMVPLSVSVTDADNMVDYQGSLLSELLLSSEVRGYIRNPMQYFRSDSDDAGRNLDLLMMVAGWRCYSWEEMSGVNPHELRYYPEEAIDMEGRVVSFVRALPKPGAEISVMVTEKNVPDSVRRRFSDRLIADSCGRFSLSYDLNGKWDLLMTVSENGKKKDHRILLDRLFSPDPRRYEPAEMLLDFTDTVVSDGTAAINDSDSIDNGDSAVAELDEETATESDKAIKLKEVVVKGKRNREAEIFKARSRSFAYYDMQEELGDLADKGEVVGNDLFDVLKSLDPGFQRVFVKGDERILYKTKKPLFVIDYKTTYENDTLNYTLLYPESVKSIFITADPATMMKYADPLTNTMFDIDSKYGCAVLIETFPERKGPAGRGTRLQSIEGYTVPEEFQNVDNESMIEDPDFRRTLYWNPLLTTGADGKARIEFFNNSTCRHMRVSVQGVDGNGTIYSN